jgi:hypothetical protein
MVGDDEIDPLARQDLERLHDIRCAQGSMTGAFQRVIDQQTDGRLVVDVKDCGHYGG